jgi:hypothetical protein
MSNYKRILSGILLAILTVSIVLAPATALAKKDHDKLKGPITAIDTTAGTITVDDRKDGLVTVNVSDETNIRVDNQKNATIADLSVGDHAKVRYKTTTNTAEKIKARSPKVEGFITAIDLGASTVTIQPQSPDAAVTVNVTELTKLRRDGKTATIADLKVGDHAQARYDATTLDASKLEAQGTNHE